MSAEGLKVKREAKAKEVYRRKWLTMLTVSAGVIMSTIDGSIVNISLPAITSTFEAGISHSGWVITGYLLTISCTLLNFGHISDYVGRKRIYILGFVVFAVSSALCGLSVSLWQLVFFRIIQGLGASMLIANGAAIITYSFPAEERGRAMGVMGLAVGSGLSFGPVLGGFLVFTLGWRSIFLINVPVGIAGVILARAFIPDRLDDEARPKIDFFGAAFYSILIVSFLMMVSLGQEWGWFSGAEITLYSIFGLSLLIFWIMEKRSKKPILEPALLRNRYFSSSAISALFAFEALFALVFMIPFYLVSMRGFTEWEAGRIMMSVPLLLLVSSVLSGWLSDKIGTRFLTSAGLAIMAAGLMSISQVDLETSVTSLVLRLALIGFGMGVFEAPNNSALMGSAPKTMLGAAAGLMATTRSIGMMTGVAIAGLVFSARIGGYGTSAATGKMLARAMSNPTVISAFGDVFIVASSICALGMIAAMVRGRYRQP